MSRAAQSTLDARTGTFTATLSRTTESQGEVPLTLQGTYDLGLPGAEFRVVPPEALSGSSLPIPRSSVERLEFVVRDDTLFIGSERSAWEEVPLQDIGPGSLLMLGFPTEIAAAPAMLELLNNEEWITDVTPVSDGEFRGKILSRAAIGLLNAGELNALLNQIRQPEDVERAFSGYVSFDVSLAPDGTLTRARVDLTPILRAMIEVIDPATPSALGAEASSVWTFRDVGEPVNITNLRL